TGSPQTGHDAPAQNHGNDHHDKVCQICVFSKILSHLALYTFVAVVFAVLSACCVISIANYFHRQNSVSVYPARAPPAFLS
ncbi:MAG: hypothetical protein HY052_07880, partial [Proteobacteria bacterium]|nr:hypothetical protein [Pseudomonadota bacterium]